MVIIITKRILRIVIRIIIIKGLVNCLAGLLKRRHLFEGND